MEREITAQYSVKREKFAAFFIQSRPRSDVSFGNSLTLRVISDRLLYVNDGKCSSSYCFSNSHPFPFSLGSPGNDGN
jgi:hypothetical protein